LNPETRALQGTRLSLRSKGYIHGVVFAARTSQIVLVDSHGVREKKKNGLFLKYDVTNLFYERIEF
jgi:hypothetical protein